MTESIILNGKQYSRSDFRELACSLRDKRILAEKGGYLFKAAIISDCFNIGILPWILNGERTYHYYIRLEKEDVHTLIGSIDAKGSWSLLFIPEKGKRLADEDRLEFRWQFRKIASLFIDTGIPEDTPLDYATGLLLTQAGICAEKPISLGSLLNI